MGRDGAPGVYELALFDAGGDQATSQSSRVQRAIYFSLPGLLKAIAKTSSALVFLASKGAQDVLAESTSQLDLKESMARWRVACQTGRATANPQHANKKPVAAAISHADGIFSPVTRLRSSWTMAKAQAAPPNRPKSSNCPASATAVLAIAIGVAPQAALIANSRRLRVDSNDKVAKMLMVATHVAIDATIANNVATRPRSVESGDNRNREIGTKPPTDTVPLQNSLLARRISSLEVVKISI